MDEGKGMRNGLEYSCKASHKKQKSLSANHEHHNHLTTTRFLAYIPPVFCLVGYCVRYSFSHHWLLSF